MTGPEIFPYRPEHWMDDAACIGHDPSLWEWGLHTDLQTKATARAICASCPVVAQCLDYARRTKSEHLMWGGQCENQRRGRKGAA